MSTQQPLRHPLEALEEAARVARLVVAVDFDGTLAPFVPDPDDARAAEGSMETLRELASFPNTTVVLVSGRHRESLARVSGVPADSAAWGIELIGSHGEEWESGAKPLDETESLLYERVLRGMEEIAADVPGAGLEIKPTAIVLHVRRVSDPTDAAEALQLVVDGPGTLPGAHVTLGKAVAEVTVRPASKGSALEQLRARDKADSVVFFGDDVTDETGFAVLGQAAGGSRADVAVKVGEGDTLARYRVPDIAEVVRCLEILRDNRRPTAQ